jgi:hypothetical protein
VPGKSNTYTLGEFGVNRVKSPIHLVDGELLTAQNAEVSSDKGNRAIRKRAGLGKLNTSAAAGAILAMTNIPFPDPFVPLDVAGTRLYAPTTSGANTYLSSLDGVTWAASNPFERPAGPLGGDGFGNRVFTHGGFLSTTGALYFVDETTPGFGVADGKLKRWDGATLATLTSNNLADLVVFLDECRALVLHGGDIYAVGTGGTNCAVARFTGSAWENIIDTPSFDAYTACSGFNRIYIPSASQEMLFWSEALGQIGAGGDTPFTGNAGATMYPAEIIMTPWGVIVALDRNGQDPELLWRLSTSSDTAANTGWSDLTPAAPNNKGCWGPMALWNGVLYIGRHTDTNGGGGVTYTGCELWSYNGTTVTLVKDLTTVVTNANEIRSMLVFNGALYLVVVASTDPTNNIVRTTDAATFTVPVAKNAADGERPHGELGFY